MARWPAPYSVQAAQYTDCAQDHEWMWHIRNATRHQRNTGAHSYLLSMCGPSLIGRHIHNLDAIAHRCQPRGRHKSRQLQWTAGPPGGWPQRWR